MDTILKALDTDIYIYSHTINKLSKVQIAKSQNDIGANTSITDNKSSILLYQYINHLAVDGVQKGNPAITCSGKSYHIWKSTTGKNLLVPVYYCAESDGTIISPNSVQQYHANIFRGFHMYFECDATTGHPKFYHRDGVSHAIRDAYSVNNLWYHDIPQDSSDTPSTIKYIHPKINRLNKAAKYELWHQRLLHPGVRCMCGIHKHVIGIDEPLTGNSFYRCAACMQGKPKKSARGPSVSLKHKGKHTRTRKHKTPHIIDNENPPDEIDDIFIPDALPGQHFHMDFGFVRGSTYTIKQEDGPTITSKDGYNSYLLIIDRATRYMWVFLTTSKHPPISIAQRVLHKLKTINPHRTVRTD